MRSSAWLQEPVSAFPPTAQNGPVDYENCKKFERQIMRKMPRLQGIRDKGMQYRRLHAAARHLSLYHVCGVLCVRIFSTQQTNTTAHMATCTPATSDHCWPGRQQVEGGWGSNAGDLLLLLQPKWQQDECTSTYKEDQPAPAIVSSMT